MLDANDVKEKLKLIHSKLDSVAKTNVISNNDEDALVEMSYEPDMSGEVNLQIPVSREIEDQIQQSIVASGIRKDKFITVCRGRYSVPDKDVSIYCSIDNEDGIPVSMLPEMDPNVKQRVKDLTKTLTDTFYMA